MAILTVTVYKINGVYHPSGCEREIACGKIRSLRQNVSLELPALAPLHCDDAVPAPVTTEIILLPNGEMWWVAYSGESVIKQCLDLQNTASIQNQTFQLTEDGEIEVSDGLVVALGIKPTGGGETVSVGTTPAGTELIDNKLLTNNEWHIESVGYRSDGTTTLYITGITGPTTIILYKL